MLLITLIMRTNLPVLPWYRCWFDIYYLLPSASTYDRTLSMVTNITMPTKWSLKRGLLSSQPHAIEISIADMIIYIIAFIVMYKASKNAILYPENTPLTTLRNLKIILVVKSINPPTNKIEARFFLLSISSRMGFQ